MRLNLPRLETPLVGPRDYEPRRIALDLVLLTLVVLVGYFLWIGDLPPQGEEGRRARGAINMIETGDWTVVRQGGLDFPDRPPMTNWLIAFAGTARAEVDVVAIRLPSILAVLATTLLLYLYCIRVDSRVTALTAAAAYATFGQVLQIGRLGESESVFAFFVACSLLLWHVVFICGGRPVWAWVLGYGFAALGALTKGPQAPVYFVATVGVYLLLQRRWRWLFGWGQWIGLTCFILIVAAWQVPYFLRTDLQASIDTWFAVVGPRLGFSGLLEQVASYPLETLGCLLPWSLLLLALGRREVRKGLAVGHPQVSFILTSLAVTYPTVWFSTGAKGRYYLPLYPCLAILVGVLVDRVSQAPADSASGRVWRAVLRATTGYALVAVALLGFVWVVEWEWAVALRQSTLGAALVVVAAGLAVAAAREARLHPGSRTTAGVVLSAALLLGSVYTTFWYGSLINRRQDVRPLVVALRAKVPAPEQIVSLGPLDARFAYPYQHFIREVPWPTTLDEVLPDLDYFCFDVRLTDNAKTRYAVRGMRKWWTPGTLPFEWEEIGRVGVGHKAQNPAPVGVLVGRARRGPDGELIPSAAPVESP